MKRLKRTLRLFALILFMAFALAGIGLLGIPPALTKDNKLFADIEAVSENSDDADAHSGDTKTQEYR